MDLIAESNFAQAPSSGRTVLLVEDEATLAASLSYYLGKQGFNVIVATDGVDGLEMARREQPDVIVLDVMLPRMDGLEVCRRLRPESAVPILMLTARTEEMDRVIGLELGADDYLTKPCSMRELTARVRALIRRSEQGAMRDRPVRVTASGMDIDERGRTVQLHGRQLYLKPKEFDLLFCLASNSGRVFTRQQLLARVWGYEFSGGSRTVDVHVRWLRQKLEDEPSRPKRILTVRGVGYKFAAPGHA